MPQFPFHLAFCVQDLALTRRFYVDLLGCEVGREAERWIDFNLHGHQISAHLCDAAEGRPTAANQVDRQRVPVPHFGVVLDWQTWHALRDRLQAAGVEFLLEPQIRFAGGVGEQATMFFADPSDNVLEFKAFVDSDQLFACE